MTFALWVVSSTLEEGGRHEEDRKESHEDAGRAGMPCRPIRNAGRGHGRFPAWSAIMIALSVELAREFVQENGVTAIVTQPLTKLAQGLVNTTAGVVGAAAMLGLATALAVPNVRLAKRRRRRRA